MLSESIRSFTSKVRFEFVIILAFVIIKLAYLNLPYYWDEAWSYAMAVLDMHEHGLAILPGDGNIELTRGHPLLFYFLSALWTKIFGTSLIAVHSFPLLISCITLYSVYLVASDISGKPAGLIAMILVMLQPEFLTQSTMLLPEIMMALWTLLTLFSYIKRQWIWFMLFSILLVMTKETGIVLVGILFIDKLFLEKYFPQKKQISLTLRIRELLALTFPLLVFVTFMIIQKIRSGWFLFPEHLNMIVFSPAEILHKLEKVVRIFFLHGRFIFFIVSAICLIVLIRKKLIIRSHVRFLLLSSIIICFYIALYTMNFFTVRYLLCIIPLLIITGIWLISSTLPDRWYRIIPFMGFALLFGLHSYILNISEQDVSLGFRNTVLLHKQVVNYVEEQNWQNKTIYTAFLMQYNMAVPELGYLNMDKPFYSVKNNPEIDYDIFIFCSNEKDPKRKLIQENQDITLIRKFEKNDAWVEVYGK